MKHGCYHSATAEGITGTVWKDTKDVSFLSNVHSSTGQDNVSRKKQDGSAVVITAPPVVKDYNNNMGAIDKNDQLKKTYAIDCKSKKWWMRIFFSPFRYLQIKFIYCLSAMLSEVEQWPNGGGCSPHHGSNEIYLCSCQISLWNIHLAYTPGPPFITAKSTISTCIWSSVCQCCQK